MDIDFCNRMDNYTLEEYQKHLEDLQYIKSLLKYYNKDFTLKSECDAYIDTAILSLKDGILTKNFNFYEKVILQSLNNLYDCAKETGSLSGFVKYI